MITRLLQFWVLAIASSFFASLFATGRLLRYERSRTAMILCFLFLALAVDALFLAIPVILRLHQAPRELGLRTLPWTVWARIASRSLVSIATWWAALHLTGVTRDATDPEHK